MRRCIGLVTARGLAFACALAALAFASSGCRSDEQPDDAGPALAASHGVVEIQRNGTRIAVASYRVMVHAPGVMPILSSDERVTLLGDDPKYDMTLDQLCQNYGQATWILAACSGCVGDYSGYSDIGTCGK